MPAPAPTPCCSRRPTRSSRHFGADSLEAHLRAAAAAGVSVQLVIDPALGFDLDTPDDLERLDVARLLALQGSGQAALAGLEPAAAEAG